MTLGALLIAKSDSMELLAYSFLEKDEIALARFYRNASKGFSRRLDAMFLSEAEKVLSDSEICDFREKLKSESYMKTAIADVAEKFLSAYLMTYVNEEFYLSLVHLLGMDMCLYFEFVLLLALAGLHIQVDTIHHQGYIYQICQCRLIPRGMDMYAEFLDFGFCIILFSLYAKLVCSGRQVAEVDFVLSSG